MMTTTTHIHISPKMYVLHLLLIFLMPDVLGWNLEYNKQHKKNEKEKLLNIGKILLQIFPSSDDGKSKRQN